MSEVFRVHHNKGNSEGFVKQQTLNYTTYFSSKTKKQIPFVAQ